MELESTRDRLLAEYVQRVADSDDRRGTLQRHTAALLQSCDAVGCQAQTLEKFGTAPRTALSLRRAVVDAKKVRLLEVKAEREHRRGVIGDLRKWAEQTKEAVTDRHRRIALLKQRIQGTERDLSLARAEWTLVMSRYVLPVCVRHWGANDGSAEGGETASVATTAGLADGRKSDSGTGKLAAGSDSEGGQIKCIKICRYRVPASGRYDRFVDAHYRFTQCAGPAAHCGKYDAACGTHHVVSYNMPALAYVHLLTKALAHVFQLRLPYQLRESEMGLPPASEAAFRTLAAKLHANCAFVCDMLAGGQDEPTDVADPMPPLAQLCVDIRHARVAPTPPKVRCLPESTEAAFSLLTADFPWFDFGNLAARAPTAPPTSHAQSPAPAAAATSIDSRAQSNTVAAGAVFELPDEWERIDEHQLALAGITSWPVDSVSGAVGNSLNSEASGANAGLSNGGKRR